MPDKPFQGYWVVLVMPTRLDAPFRRYKYHWEVYDRDRVLVETVDSNNLTKSEREIRRKYPGIQTTLQMEAPTLGDKINRLQRDLALQVDSIFLDHGWQPRDLTPVDDLVKDFVARLRTLADRKGKTS